MMFDQIMGIEVSQTSTQVVIRFKKGVTTIVKIVATYSRDGRSYRSNARLSWKKPDEIAVFPLVASDGGKDPYYLVRLQAAEIGIHDGKAINSVQDYWFDAE